MHPAVWGPSFWAVLHALVAVPATAEQAVLMCRFLHALQQVLPCETCRQSFAALLAARRESLHGAVTAGTYLAWLYALHLQVTHKVLREQYAEAGVTDPEVQARLLAAHDDNGISLEECRTIASDNAVCTPVAVFMCVGSALCCARVVADRKCVLHFACTLSEVMQTVAGLPRVLAALAVPLAKFATGCLADDAALTAPVAQVLHDLARVLLGDGAGASRHALVMHLLHSTED